MFHFEFSVKSSEGPGERKNSSLMRLHIFK